ncbi:hypothetical protein MMN80_28005, partial [Escherichia coli]|nr:hypothetical protein [Escherichia coli]
YNSLFNRGGRWHQQYIELSAWIVSMNGLAEQVMGHQTTAQNAVAAEYQHLRLDKGDHYGILG